MTIKSFLTQLLEHCGIESVATEIIVDEQPEIISIQINLPEEESGIVIGFHGEVLESLQRVVRVVFSRQYPDKKITLNINDYCERRKEKLVELAKSSARRVLETHYPFTFKSFLPSYERFLVHSTISQNPEFDQLESISEGEGRMRRLTIKFKDQIDDNNQLTKDEVINE